MAYRSCRPEDFDAFVARNENRLFRAALSMTGNASDAEDILQEVFLRAYEKAPEFTSGEHEKAWLMKVTINLCKSRLRSPWHKRRVAMLESYPATEPEQHELMEQVMSLPSKYRSVIHLYYYEGYSVKDISELTGQRESTVRSHLTRARQRLRSFLKEEVMKAYKDYMDKITVSDALHRKLVSHASGNVRPVLIRRYAAAFACLALALVCTYAVTQLYQNNTPQEPGKDPYVTPGETPVAAKSGGSQSIAGHSNTASDESDTNPSVSQSDDTSSAGQPEGSPSVSKPDEAPSVPFQDESPSVADILVKRISDSAGTDVLLNNLSLDEARADADFGAYLPKTVPSGFAFESATRYVDEKSNHLTALWFKGMRMIHWSVSKLDVEDKARITSVSDTKNYDLALYPIPHAESVPEDLREIVDDPIFIIDDLTLDAVKARAYEVQDAGDISGPRMSFSVLYGDTLIKLYVKGASPESVFDMLMQIKA